MLTPGSHSARTLRAAFVGAWVALGAVTAHAAAGGGALPVVALLPVVAGAAAVVALLGRRRLRFGELLALLALSQVLVHLLTAYVHGHPMAPSPTMTLAHLLSVAVVAWGIADVERLWWAWWARATLLVSALRPVPMTLVPPPAPLSTVAVARPGILAHAVVRRGPPLS